MKMFHPVCQHANLKYGYEHPSVFLTIMMLKAYPDYKQYKT